MSTTVKKRNGRGTEPLNLEKMHRMVEEACKGIAGVSASQVEIQSGIQIYDGITTAEIQEILIKSASDLIDLDNPNYQYVAARLLLFAVRKSLYGKVRELPHLESQIMGCTSVDVYDKGIFDKYSKEEIEKESLGKGQSVGFLISENKERIIISSIWDGYYASGEITIPKKMIIKKIDMPIIVPKIE